MLGAAQPRGGFDNRLEHRLEIEGRAADDLEHVARRGLIFERFLEVAGALLQFADQPRVLDRDHRLVGEGLHQLDLSLGERLDALARQCDDADRLAFAQQRHPELSAQIAERCRFAEPVFRVGSGVGDMHCLALQRDPAGNRSPVGDERMLFDECPKLAGGLLRFRREGNSCCYAVHLAIAAVDRAVAGVAEPGGRFGKGVEHRLQIEGRAADDLQHVAGRGLVFERFLEVGGALRNSPSSRAFSIAITACAAKFCSSAICLSENGPTS